MLSRTHTFLRALACRVGRLRVACVWLYNAQLQTESVGVARCEYIHAQRATMALCATTPLQHAGNRRFVDAHPLRNLGLIQPLSAQRPSFGSAIVNAGQEPLLNDGEEANSGLSSHSSSARCVASRVTDRGGPVSFQQLLANRQ